MSFVENETLASSRRAMVEDLIRRGIRDPRVLDAMSRLPRQAFVARDLAERAYDDNPLPIGGTQTISQPYMVARMLEYMATNGTERILEVGAGSGYVAALLGLLSPEVYAVEIVPELAKQAQERLAEFGLHHVQVECRDGTQGWPEKAPFGVILVSAGAPTVPPLLLDQLEEGGRLIVPVGDRGQQILVRVTRHGDEYVQEQDIPCRFVDLVGRYGWDGPGAPQA